MNSHHDVLIVGAGQAGAAAAVALRQAGFAGSVALLGDETGLPYERPPLSKDYLSGNRSLERLLLRPGEFWQAQAVTLLPGRRVCGISPDLHTVQTTDGETFGYGSLIWAAGGHARPLSCPGAELAGVHTIRRRVDADQIRARLATTGQVVIVGGGFIGLEAAAELRKLGKEVCVVEALDRVLARVCCATISHFFEREHRAHGVQLRLNAGVEAVLGTDGHVSGVRLRDGTVLEAQVVIAGIGILPAIEPLIAAGAAGTQGVEVDACCRTGLADIYAIGDCVVQANPFAAGAAVRLESIQNATEQATRVARALAGEPPLKPVVPWFWSNQFDLKLQTVGLSAGYDDTVLRGSQEARKFSVIYLREGRVIALDCINSPGDFMHGRALVQAGARIAPALLADSSRSLNASGTTSHSNERGSR